MASVFVMVFVERVLGCPAVRPGRGAKRCRRLVQQVRHDLSDRRRFRQGGQSSGTVYIDKGERRSPSLGHVHGAVVHRDGRRRRRRDRHWNRQRVCRRRRRKLNRLRRRSVGHGAEDEARKHVLFPGDRPADCGESSQRTLFSYTTELCRSDCTEIPVTIHRCPSNSRKQVP